MIRERPSEGFLGEEWWAKKVSEGKTKNKEPVSKLAFWNLSGPSEDRKSPTRAPDGCSL